MRYMRWGMATGGDYPGLSVGRRLQCSRGTVQGPDLASRLPAKAAADGRRGGQLT